jgi:hypothetical protein
VIGRKSSGRGPRLTDERVRLLLAGQAPDEDASLAQLAWVVRSTRQLYLEPPRPALRERQEAMIVAAGRRLAVEAPAAGPPAATGSRPYRLGAALRAHPRRLAALAATALAVTGAWLVVEADRKGAPTVTDRPSPDRVSDASAAGAGSAQRNARAGQAEGRRRRAPDARAGSPAASTPNAQTPPAVDSELAAQPPAVGGVAPRPEIEGPLDTEPPAKQQGYGGPNSQPTPLKKPLDTEPPIAIPPDGHATPDSQGADEPTGEPTPTP